MAAINYLSIQKLPRGSRGIRREYTKNEVCAQIVNQEIANTISDTVTWIRCWILCSVSDDIKPGVSIRDTSGISFSF